MLCMHLVIFVEARLNKYPYYNTTVEHIWGERSEMMLAHDIVGKKEDEDIERQYKSVLKCIGVRYYGGS